VSEKPPLDQLSPVKRAILELREMRARLDEVEGRRREPVAVVGIGCRFPGGADDPESFWRLLESGVDAITEVPPDRWDVDAYFDPDPDAPGKMSTRYGGFLADVGGFDPDFFGIAHREALSMDPQQRLLLEVSWEALEHAGVAPSRLNGAAVGVFVGIGSFDYAQLHARTGDVSRIDAYLATGSAHSVASGRLSYLLGLRGPSVSLDTACSSSLVAVHLACQSLRDGDCRLALAGGVNLILLPEIAITLSKARMMAPDGRCKAFAAAADGFVRSEGCGVVVLKRLSDARADGDRILALVRGTAVNQDGRSGGLTAPNGPSQESVIREALARAGVEPSELGYVEAHGTGTALGDPIEARALGSVLGPAHARRSPLAMGSVKTNIGHLEAAAGVAGMIKAVLALQHREIPPHLHLDGLNPEVPWEELPIVIPTRRTPWPSGGERRIAGVSSFGFSGTNAHVVLEEAPSPPDGSSSAVPAARERPLHLLALSAKGEPALREVARRLSRRLGERPSESLADVAFTANAGRSHFPQRAAVVAATADQACEALLALSEGRGGARRGEAYDTTPPGVSFLFTGQGSQYVGMGRVLFETQPTFRRTLEHCHEILEGRLDRPLLSMIFGEGADGTLLDETAFTQPALFALEYALYELWRSWGVQPVAVMGHSVGEYVAACAAGVFGLEDGLRLIAERGRLMQALPRDGEMVAVFAGEERVAAVVAPHAAEASIAAINGPESVVVSGRRDAVEAVVRTLGASGVRSRRLSVSHAFHSPLMDPILDDFERAARGVKYSPPRLALASNLTGRVAGSDEVSQAAYWRRHVREPVRFRDSLEALHREGCRLFLELGPSPTLLAMGERCLPRDAATWLASLRKGRDDWEPMLDSLATLYVNGAAVDWAGFDADYRRQRVTVPTYPFQRERYWIEGASPARPAAAVPIEDSWTAALAAARRQAREGPLDLAPSTYPEKWRCLDRLAAAHVVEALRRLGAFSEAGESRDLEGLLALGIQPGFSALVSRWLDALVADGHLRREGAAYACGAAPGLLESARGEARRALADVPFLLEHVERCGASLAAVLTGRASAVETLFPGGSFAIVEAFAGDWAVARYFNGIARAAIEAAARARAGNGVRVLEVGGRTGAVAASLLPALPPGRGSYLFTETAETFLARARERFGTLPHVDYRLLDVARSPEEQGLAGQEFDVVVAPNALFGPREPRTVLAHLRSLLARGGLLLLYEPASHPLWYDVAFGMVEEARPRVDGERVGEETLRSIGYHQAASFPEAGSPAESLGRRLWLVQASPAMEEQPPPAAATATVAGAPVEEVLPAFRRQWDEAPAGERRALLAGVVSREAARVLGRDPEHALDPRHRLMDLGFDSLLAVEFRSRLEQALGLPQTLPATLIFDYPSIDSVAEFLERDVFGTGEPGAAPTPAVPAAPVAALEPLLGVEVVERLSDEEAEALLMKKLGRLGRS